MIGAEDVVAAMLTQLKRYVPTVLAELAAPYTSNEVLFPNGFVMPPVALFDTPAQPVIADYPTVLVDPGPDGTPMILDPQAGAVSYRERWTPKVFCWARGADFKETTFRTLLLRHAVRTVLASDPTIGTQTINLTWTLSLDLGSLRSSGMLANPTLEARLVQGSYVECTVNAYETTQIPTLPGFTPGVANTIDLTVVEHPALAGL